MGYDFYIIVDAVDRKWRRDPPKMPVSLPRISKNDTLLSEGAQVRVKLDEPISVLGKKLHGKFRTGDIRWDPEIQTIKKLILSPDQPPTYLLNGSHGRLGVSRCAYTRKQLQIVPDNENPPPDFVIRVSQSGIFLKGFLSNGLKRVNCNILLNGSGIQKVK